MPDRIDGDHHQGQALHAHRVELVHEIAQRDLAREEGRERPPGQDPHPARMQRHRRPDATDGPNQAGRRYSSFQYYAKAHAHARRTLNVSTRGGRAMPTRTAGRTTRRDKTGHADSPRQDSQRPAHSDHADVGGQESTTRRHRAHAARGGRAAAGRAAGARRAPSRSPAAARADGSRSGRARTGAPRTRSASATTWPAPSPRRRRR